MKTVILAQQQEIQAFKLAISTVRQEEAKKAMAEVNDEIKIKFEETELKSIELRLQKAVLEASNKKLEKHSKMLKDMVHRFEHLDGDINDAEEADGGAWRVVDNPVKMHVALLALEWEFGSLGADDG